LTAGGDELEIAYAVGYSEEAIRRYQRFPLSAPLPLADAARAGEGVFLASREEALARYPRLAEGLAELGEGSLAALPLPAAGRVLGALGLSWRGARGLEEEERAFTLSLVRQCAQALERARLYDAERRARLEKEEPLALLDTLLAEARVGIAFLDPDLR